MSPLLLLCLLAAQQPSVYPRVPAGGAISSHNANDMKLAMPDFVEAITNNPELETTVRETRGGGFTFSVRKN